jgi:hypothetical protein
MSKEQDIEQLHVQLKFLSIKEKKRQTGPSV